MLGGETVWLKEIDKRRTLVMTTPVEKLASKEKDEIARFIG